MVQFSNAVEKRIGRFILVRQLHSTSYASVYQAKDSQGGKEVVLKVFSPHLSLEVFKSTGYLALLQRVSSIRHPSIVPVLESGVAGTQWIVMPYLAKGSLKERLATPWHPADVVAVLEHVGSALDAAHAQGILHNDLKPANVLMGDDGAYLLADFGMAIVAPKAELIARLGASTPMPGYMSPEQAAGLSLNPKSDVYALGVLAYHLLTGTVPYTGTDPTTILGKQRKGPPADPSEVNPAVGPGVRDVVLKAMALNPDARYASGVEFAAAFRVAAAESPPSYAPRPITPSPAKREPGAWSRALGVCPACGFTNLEGADLCERCGTLVPRPALPSASPAYLAWGTKRLSRLTKPLLALTEYSRTLLIGVLALGTALLVTLIVSFASSAPSAISALSSISAPGEWAMYGFDPARTGFDPQPAPLPAGAVKWSAVMNSPLLAAPVVSGNVLYAGTGDRRIMALNAETGGVIWERPTQFPVDTTPAVAGDYVYLGLRDGTLNALRKVDGSSAWTYPTRGLIVGSALVKNGVVYGGNGDGLVFALDARTGEELWKVQLSSSASAGPSISEHNVLAVPARDSLVHFLDASSGKERLGFVIAGLVTAPVVFYGDTAYLATSAGTLVAVDARAKNQFGDWSIYRIKSALFGWGYLKNVPAPRGFLWSAGGRQQPAGLAVSDRQAFLTTQNGKAYAIDLTARKQSWIVSTGSAKEFTPVVHADAVYVSSTDGKVLALRADTGAVLMEWQAPGGNALSTPPMVAKGVIYVSAATDLPSITVERIGSEGRLLPNQTENAEGSWSYRYGPSPCSAATTPSGSYQTKADAASAAKLYSPGCGILYAIK